MDFYSFLRAASVSCAIIHLTPQTTLVWYPWRQTYVTHITTYEHLLVMNTVCDHFLEPNTADKKYADVVPLLLVLETLSPGGEDS